MNPAERLLHNLDQSNAEALREWETEHRRLLDVVRHAEEDCNAAVAALARARLFQPHPDAEELDRIHNRYIETHAAEYKAWKVVQAHWSQHPDPAYAGED